MQRAIREMQRYFSELGKLRERVLKLAGDVRRGSARAIRNIHRGNGQAAERLIERAGRKLRQLLELTKRDPWLQTYGDVVIAQQEYAEARMLQSLLSRGEIPKPRSLGVGYRAYLGGVSDVIGELRRCTLDSLRRGDVKRAEHLLNLMEELYDLLMGFDYVDSVFPGLRRKQDVARQLIERTRGDLTMIAGQKKTKTS